MARRRFRRRRTLRRRRRRIGLPRRVNRSYVPRLVNRPHFFKRTCCITTSNVNTAVAGVVGTAISQSSDSWLFDSGAAPGVNVNYFSMAMEFTLDMLPSYAEFTALYDAYKINRVKVKITPYSNSTLLQTGVGTASNQALSGIIHSVLDFDDASAFAAGTSGIDLMRQYTSYRTRNFFGKPHKFYILPRIAQAAYGGGVFASYANTKPKWIDCNSPSVQHYGLKWICETFNPDTSARTFIWFKLEATLYFEMRFPR